jgi:uncharacterized protein (TIGR00369 family)
VIEWEAGDEYTFRVPGGRVVHGGMVTTLLDTAMGAACASALDDDNSFLTADLHVEFLRPTRPGRLRADARVVRKTRSVVFCAGELYDAEGAHLASARCTQVLRDRR